jgi:hypothetical protein
LEINLIYVPGLIAQEGNSFNWLMFLSLCQDEISPSDGNLSRLEVLWIRPNFIRIREANKLRTRPDPDPSPTLAFCVGSENFFSFKY